MADAGKDQDQSMEDILQSIKRIIAEEGEPAAPGGGSDVLELTELLAEDGSISNAKPHERNNIPTMSIDEIMAAPVSSAPVEFPAPAAAPEPVEVITPPPPPAPAPAPAPAPVPAPQPAAQDDSLISAATLSASVSALNSLRDSLSAPSSAPRIDSPVFRSGTTVEDLVREALKPMLKEWMDQNLTGIVESLVRKEISKLTQR